MLGSLPPIRSLLPVIDRVTFPYLFVAFHILTTLPVTTCSCERFISVLRRLKTMGQDQLNSLALIHVHREIDVDAHELIEIFARRHPRRMKLLDILNTDPE